MTATELHPDVLATAQVLASIRLELAARKAPETATRPVITTERVAEVEEVDRDDGINTIAANPPRA